MKRTYTPYGGASLMWKCKDRALLYDGPAGTGKSRGVLEKVMLAAMKYKGMRALLVRDTRTSMSQSVLVTFESHVAVNEKGERLPWVSGPSRATRTSYVLPNGSEIVLGGMDNPDRIMSTEYDLIAVFEATEVAEAAIEQLTTRLRNGVMPYQQLICDCNPAGPTHHLKRAADAAKMTRIPSRHRDNPVLFDQEKQDWTPRGREYLQVLSMLTGHRRSRLLEGHWAASEGLVYPNFDPAVHVIDRMPDGWQAWPKLRTIDFGFTNPLVCQWWAVDPDGRLYLYREYVKSKVTVSDHAPAIKALSGDERYTVNIADHDADDRAELLKQGIETVAAKKAVSVGVQAVTARLAVQADGKPRLFVLRGSLVEQDNTLADAKRPCGFLAEVDSYVYPKTKEGKQEKEEPVKEHDHSMDAARYAVAYFDVGNSLGAAALSGGLKLPSDAKATWWGEGDELTEDALWSEV
jgi:phage terminase large subunit